MYKKLLLIITCLSFCYWGRSQSVDTLTIPRIIPLPVETSIIRMHEQDTISESEAPEVMYNFIQRCKIQDIKVKGVNQNDYPDYTLITYSGLKVGEVVAIPGEEITDAVNRFWRQGLYSDVKILASKIEDEKV